MITANKTDIGHTRTLNEDRVWVQNELNGFTLAMVADGMGGHKAGDIASQMTIETIQAQLLELRNGMSVEDCETILRKAIYTANEAVFHLASTKPEYQGMGTTVVLAIATEETVMIANIGDSRAYKISGHSLVQITEDHSLVTELVKSGEISAEEAHVHPRRNVVTRAMGTEPSVDVDLYHEQWSVGDMLLLCSDGLTGYVDDEQMKEILCSEHDLQSKADRLITAALEAGGEDNITVALLSNTAANEQGMG